MATLVITQSSAGTSSGDAQLIEYDEFGGELLITDLDATIETNSVDLTSDTKFIAISFYPTTSLSPLYVLSVETTSGTKTATEYYDEAAEENTLTSDLAITIDSFATAASSSSLCYFAIPATDSTDYFRFTSTSSFSVSHLTRNSGTLQYSVDLVDWTDWNDTTQIDVTSTVYIRGTGNTTFGNSTDTTAYWTITGSNVECHGDIRTLLDYATVQAGNDPTTTSYTFKCFFYGCTALTTSPTLPSTSLATYCYQYMFYNCTGLTAAPTLAAMTLASYCYAYMFRGCTALTTCPELPATALASYCYMQMFYGCTGITTTMAALPATSAVSYCYQYMFSGCSSITAGPSIAAISYAEHACQGMFQYCTSLIQTPEILATSVDTYGCEYMFNGCTSLTTASELPATTVGTYCYSYMFQDCTALVNGPSILPATTIASYCYQYMFNQCRALTVPPDLPATAATSYCYQYMFNNCDSLLVMPKISATTVSSHSFYFMIPGCFSLVVPTDLYPTTMSTYCYAYMFYGDTSLQWLPTLPMTTLATYCCYQMFYGCTALTTVPVLLATSLQSRCYYEMFRNCSSLKLASSRSTNYGIPYRIPASGTGTTATYALSYMFTSTGGTFTGTPSINTTYYQYGKKYYDLTTNNYTNTEINYNGQDYTLGKIVHIKDSTTTEYPLTTTKPTGHLLSFGVDTNGNSTTVYVRKNGSYSQLTLKNTATNIYTGTTTEVEAFYIVGGNFKTVLGNHGSYTGSGTAADPYVLSEDLALAVEIN